MDWVHWEIQTVLILGTSKAYSCTANKGLEGRPALIFLLSTYSSLAAPSKFIFSFQDVLPILPLAPPPTLSPACCQSIAFISPHCSLSISPSIVPSCPPSFPYTSQNLLLPISLYSFLAVLLLPLLHSVTPPFPFLPSSLPPVFFSLTFFFTFFF